MSSSENIETKKKEVIVYTRKRKGTTSHASHKKTLSHLNISSEQNTLSYPTEDISFEKQTLSHPTEEISSEKNALTHLAKDIFSEKRALSHPTEDISSEKKILAHLIEDISAQEKSLAHPTKHISSEKKALTQPAQDISSLKRALSLPIEDTYSEKKTLSHSAEVSEKKASSHTIEDIFSKKALSHPTEDISSEKKVLSHRLGNDDGKDREVGEDGSHYDCEICFDGGELLCCDSCPRTYHLECLLLKSVPDGRWECFKCSSPSASKSKIKSLKKGKRNKKK